MNLQNMMMQAAILGIDSCAIEGYNESELNEILGIDPSKKRVAMLLPFGYRIKEQPTEEIKLFQRELHGIANNINQIARISNSRYSTSHDDYNYISKELSDFILRFEKEIYSRKK